MASIARPPQGVQEVVKAFMREHHAQHTPQHSDEHPQDPPIPSAVPPSRSNASSPPGSPRMHQSPRLSALQNLRFNAGTPSERTGPPRSISYNYSVSGSHPASRANSHDEREGYPSILEPTSDTEEPETFEDPDRPDEFVPVTSPFRGALEYQDPEQREKEIEMMEKRQKRRDSYFHDVFNPSKWIQTDSPRTEAAPFQLPAESEPASEVASQRPQSHRHARRGTMQSPTMSVASSSRFPPARRTRSLPHIKDESPRSNSTLPKWNRLRSLLPHIAAQGKEHAPAGASEVVPAAVNITDELIAGGLSTQMLRLWFERDEKGDRRIPILFHRLRIRVSDSLHPLHGNKAVFRIECEYANGAARWVVYRQLREFLSLHTHYTFSNAYNRNVGPLPDFPRAGIPYFNFLKERSSDFSRADFARMQRESLENYLIGLIRSVVGLLFFVHDLD
ncbi:hypothetical protein EIP86_006534 [Pleurotus ostreatoroseus]|nr:hypothetical protein EIP86_006534 [Pleurotus ostreatoroseus]